jgi:VIT1/CCC1 family predicted Fe2+/Mn2+ transporter
MYGLINTLSVVVGGVGSGTDSYHIMAVGVSVLIGDGIGMALGDYLSSKSENEYIKA